MFNFDSDNFLDELYRFGFAIDDRMSDIEEQIDTVEEILEDLDPDDSSMDLI